MRLLIALFFVLVSLSSLSFADENSNIPTAAKIERLSNQLSARREAATNEFNKNVELAAQQTQQTTEKNIAKAQSETQAQLKQQQQAQPQPQTQQQNNTQTQSSMCLCKPHSVKDSNYIFSRKGKPLYQLTPYCICSPKSKIVPKNSSGNTANNINNSFGNDTNKQQSDNSSFSIQY